MRELKAGDSLTLRGKVKDIEPGTQVSDTYPSQVPDGYYWKLRLASYDLER